MSSPNTSAPEEDYGNPNLPEPDIDEISEVRYLRLENQVFNELKMKSDTHIYPTIVQGIFES